MSSQKKKKGGSKPRPQGTMTSPASSRRELKMPSAISTVRRNATDLKASTIYHPEEGMGVRYEGHQQLCNITTAAGTDLTFFTNTTPATFTSTNLIMLSPDFLNGRLAALAGLYAKYVFRRVELEYRPLVATTQAGGGVLAYVRDPQVNVSTGTITYTTAQELETSVTFPFREPARLVMTYNGPATYFTEVDTTSQASYRQCAQGSIVGIPSSGSLGAVSQGFVFLHYVIDLFGPTPTQAIVGLSQSENAFLRDQLLKYRARAREEKKDVVMKTVEEFEVVRCEPRRK